MKEPIKEYCKQLRWGNGMVKNYESIKADTHEEFLGKLLEMEPKAWEVHRKNRCLKQANFDVIKTFNGSSLDHIEIPASVPVDDLKTAAILERRENLILYGPVGTGNTHMATAIGVEACNQGKKVKFYRTSALVNDLNDAQTAGSFGKMLKQLSKLDLLICDEWGYIPLDRQGAQLLFQVVADCYEKRSIIITTNLEFSKWNGIFYDEKLTSAIIDRLVHHSHLLVFGGQSYRLTHSTIRK